MSFVNHPVVKHKLGLLNLAEELGNVSRACKIMGVWRDTFYRYQEAKAENTLEALLYKDRRRPNLKTRVAATGAVLTEPRAGGLPQPGRPATFPNARPAPFQSA